MKKRKRVRSFVLVGILLGLCIAAAVIWLLFYRNKSYLSDAVPNVDGTIRTGGDAVELAMQKFDEAEPARIIRDAPGRTPRVGLVFMGLTEEADTNNAVLELLQKNGLKASFALSAADTLGNEDFVDDLLNDKMDLLSNGAAGESNLHTLTAEEMINTMLRARESMATAADQTIPLLYCSSTKLTGDVLRAASASGYEAVLDPDSSHVLDESSFETAADAASFVAELQGDTIVVVDLRGLVENIQEEDAVTAEKPAIDKQPDLDDSKQPEDEPDDILTKVTWLVRALKNQNVKTEYVSRFARTEGITVLREEMQDPDAEMAPLYRSCLTDRKQAGLAVKGLPAADALDAVQALLTANHCGATFFVTTEEAAARRAEMETLQNTKNSIGLYLPAGQLNGLDRGKVFDVLYDALRSVSGTSGLVLVDEQTGTEALAALRAAARLLNVKIILPANPEQMQAGALYLLDTIEEDSFAALVQKADAAGLTLTDAATVIRKSGTLPTLSAQELSALRKKNDHQLANVQNMIYTSERSEGFAQYGTNEKAAAVAAISKMEDPDLKGTFFVTLNELMSKPNAIEKILASGNTLGISYRPSDEYPETFDAVANYLNTWKKYAAWRYDTDAQTVLLPDETASDEVKEAVSAAGYTLAQIVLGTVSNGVVTLPATAAVSVDYFDSVTFIGDSLTLGMETYKTGLQNAMYCAYKGIGPDAIVRGTSFKTEDGTSEVPLEKLATQHPKAVYILLGTNVLGTDGDYSGFLKYYRLMLDEIAQAAPGATVYIQSITPVRPFVEATHPGLTKSRLQEVNQALSMIAQEKNCYYLDLWAVLADENGDLIESIAQDDGYHIKPAGYTLWVDYLRTHTAG